jgi:hypothetical protein
MHERDLATRLDVAPDEDASPVMPGEAARIVTAVLRAAQVSAQQGTEIVIRSRPVTADKDAELPHNSVLVTVSYSEGASPRATPASGEAMLDARRRVQRLGGLVWVEREPAGQTTFSFTLPVTWGEPSEAAQE